jgi:hypothetical protein
MSYLAEYQFADRHCYSALMRCQAEARDSQRLGALVSDVLEEVLAIRTIDPALRLTFSGAQLELLLWLNGSDASALLCLVERLQSLASALSIVLRRPNTASEFDSWTAVPAIAERVDTSSYRANGLEIVPRFSLAEACAVALRCAAGTQPVSYQVHLRQRTIQPDDERTVRKWLLRLREDNSIPLSALHTQEKCAVTRGDLRLLMDEWVMAHTLEDFEILHRTAEECFQADNRALGAESGPLRAQWDTEIAAAGLHSSLLEGHPEQPALAELATSVTTGTLKHRLLRLFDPYCAPGPSRRVPNQSPPVFVSYAFRDFATANRICSALEEETIGCWMAPRDIPPGSNYADCIVKGIEYASVLVLVFSERSNHSKYVLREIERAISHDLVIIPFRIDHGDLSRSLQFFLSTCQWIEGDEDTFDRGLQRLIERVRQVLQA